MSEEELIETLKAFENKRVEQLKEPARNVFYAIMKIADERDLYKQRIDKAIKSLYDKGTFNLDNEYGKVFLEILDILKGSDKE